MNLGRQIYKLLKRQAAVKVNGLGVFRRVHTPATFDAKRQLFLPPITFIEFDRNGTDGYDFLTYVQQVDRLDRKDAELAVDEVIAVILDKLNQVGYVNLDNLGQLVSFGNSFVFKPLDLSGFNYTAVEDEFHTEEDKKEEAAVLEPVVESEIPTPAVEVVESTVEEEKVENGIEDEVDKVEDTPLVTAASEEVPANAIFEQEERKSTSAYVYALVAVVAVALLAGLYYYSTQLQTTAPIVKNETVVLPLDSLEQDTTALYSSVDSLEPDSVAVDTLVTAPEVEKIKEVVPNPKHKYTIIIGTHKTLAKAYEEAEAFNKDGHKSVKVITPNLAKNLKRVVWDTYATKEERDSALRYVKKHIKTDAWPDVIR